MKRRLFLAAGALIGVVNLVSAIQAFFVISNEVIGPLLFLISTLLTLPAVIIGTKHPKAASRMLAFSMVCSIGMGPLIFVSGEKINLTDYIGVLLIFTFPTFALFMGFRWLAKMPVISSAPDDGGWWPKYPVR